MIREIHSEETGKLYECLEALAEHHNKVSVHFKGSYPKTPSEERIKTVAGSTISDMKMDYTHHYDSPLGGITLASDGDALIGLWFEGQKYFANTLNKTAEEKPLPVFEEADQWLDIYFSGKAPDFTPKLSMRTTAFRKMVWEIMLTIPFGRTMTYGQIAETVARQMNLSEMSAQAVGGAVAHNSISLIIPCHRVVGTNGSLTGYAGGIDRKIRLLKMEGTNICSRHGIVVHPVQHPDSISKIAP